MFLLQKWFPTSPGIFQIINLSDAFLIFVVQLITVVIIMRKSKNISLKSTNGCHVTFYAKQSMGQWHSNVHLKIIDPIQICVIVRVEKRISYIEIYQLYQIEWIASFVGQVCCIDIPGSARFRGRLRSRPSIPLFFWGSPYSLKKTSRCRVKNKSFVSFVYKGIEIMDTNFLYY